MRFGIGFFALMALAPCAMGQHSGNVRGWGYGYVGAGANSQGTSLHAGGGGELLMARGFGLGFEAARYGSTSRFFDNSVGILSADACYHFGMPGRSRKLVPFATGGLSVANFRSGGGNFGFGAQYWFHESVGLRLEFREHIFSSDSPYLSAFHFGLSFR